MNEQQIKEMLNSQMEPENAINLLVNVATICYNSELLTDLDRLFINKALSTLKEKIDKGENFVVKVKDESVKSPEVKTKKVKKEKVK